MRARYVVLSAALVAALLLVSCSSGGTVVSRRPYHAFDVAVSGRVLCAGVGVSGAKVKVQGTTHETWTNGVGRYSLHYRTAALPGVNSKALTLVASKSGVGLTMKSVTVVNGSTTHCNINLINRGFPD